MPRQIVVEIVGDAGKLNKATTEATEHAKGLGGKLKDVGKGVALGAGIGAFNLLSDAIGIGVGKLGEASAAYREDQASQALLAQALRNNLPAWDGSTAAVEKYAGAQGRLGFADDEVRASLGQLVGLTHDQTEAMNLNSLAQDLARAKGIDLATATDIVSKAHEGNGKALKALGVDVGDAKTAAELLDAIQQNVAGSAETWAETNDGRLAASNVKVQEAMEKVGKIVAGVAEVVVPALVEVFGFLVDRLADVWEAIQPVLTAIGTKLRPVFEFMTGTVLPALGSAFKVIFETIGGIISTAVDIWTAQFDLVKGIIEGVVKAIKSAINVAIGAVNTVIDGINSVQIHISIDPPIGPHIGFDWDGVRLGHIPYLHAGGVVPGAPGSDVLAVLQAGETVSPAGGPAGNLTINFNSTWPPTRAQAREIAEMVDEALGYRYTMAARTAGAV